MYPNSSLSQRTRRHVVLTTAHVLTSCSALLLPGVVTAGMVVVSPTTVKTAINSKPSKTEPMANTDNEEWSPCVKNLNTAALQADWTPAQRVALLNQCH